MPKEITISKVLEEFSEKFDYFPKTKINIGGSPIDLF